MRFPNCPQATWIAAPLPTPVAATVRPPLSHIWGDAVPVSEMSPFPQAYYYY